MPCDLLQPRLPVAGFAIVCGLVLLGRARGHRVSWPLVTGGAVMVVAGIYLLATTGHLGCQATKLVQLPPPTSATPTPGAPEAPRPPTYLRVRERGLVARFDDATGALEVVAGPWGSNADRVRFLVCDEPPAPGRYEPETISETVSACPPVAEVPVGGDGTARVEAVPPGPATAVLRSCGASGTCGVVAYGWNSSRDTVSSDGGIILVRTGSVG